MKLIIAGSRTFNNYDLLRKECDNFIGDYSQTVTIVSGHAKGADLWGEAYARQTGCDLKVFPADWEKYGKSAGYVRNLRMAEYATHCICFWDGKSKGTKMMIDLATKNGLDPKVINYSI